VPFLFLSVRLFFTPFPSLILSYATVHHHRSSEHGLPKLLDDHVVSQFVDNFSSFRSPGTQSICRSVVHTRQHTNRSSTYRFSNKLPDRRQVLRLQVYSQRFTCEHVHTFTRRSCGRCKVFPGIFTQRLFGRGQGETLRWDVISVDKAASSTPAPLWLGAQCRS